MIYWQPGTTLENVEQQVITAAFKFYKGNKTQTASSLGIAIRTLDSKLEKYGVKIEPARSFEPDVRSNRPTSGFNITDRSVDIRGSSGTSDTTAEKENEASVLQTGTGVRVESDVAVPEKSGVLLREQQEIQKVSPQGSAAGSPRRTR